MPISVFSGCCVFFFLDLFNSTFLADYLAEVFCDFFFQPGRSLRFPLVSQQSPLATTSHFSPNQVQLRRHGGQADHGHAARQAQQRPVRRLLHLRRQGSAGTLRAPRQMQKVRVLWWLSEACAGGKLEHS